MSKPTPVSEWEVGQSEVPPASPEVMRDVERIAAQNQQALDEMTRRGGSVGPCTVEVIEPPRGR